MSYKQDLEQQLYKYIERKNKLLADINGLDIVITLTKDKIKKAADGPVHIPDELTADGML